MLPLAKPVNYVAQDTVFEITLRAYGEVTEDMRCRLVSDSDETYSATYSVHEITPSTRGTVGNRYRLVATETIQ